MIDYDSGAFPHLLVGFKSWVTWTYVEGRKQPFAPYSDLPRYTDDDEPDQYSWSNPENLTDFDTARKWAQMHPNLVGVGFILQREGEPYKEPADPAFVIDLDDVVNPDGAGHPYAWMLVERVGTYADLSVSDTGIHLMGVGALPEGVRTIQDDLPVHPDFPDAEIEVYDGKRFVAMTGKWLRASPREFSDCSHWLHRLARRFETTTPPVGSSGEYRSVDVDNDAFADVETTDSLDELSDAIESVGPDDIRLKSSKARERASGEIDYDPCYRPSKSGASLAWFDDDGKWCDRDGMHYFDSLKLVALEERIITSVNDYPSGEDYWRAVEALRERGANIPRYERKPADLHSLHAKSSGDSEERERAMRALLASERT